MVRAFLHAILMLLFSFFVLVNFYFLIVCVYLVYDFHNKYNRKSFICFRLVPKSVTLDDFERRNSPNGTVISTNSVAFGADYVQVVEDTPILPAAEM